MLGESGTHSGAYWGQEHKTSAWFGFGLANWPVFKKKKKKKKVILVLAGNVGVKTGLFVCD